MGTDKDFAQLNVLHVLTLNGRHGEYGGPVRVAREICTELKSRGHSTHIFSGALKGSEPDLDNGLVESYVLVKPILRKFALSTLWSWKLLVSVTKLVRQVDIVHIHFGRDLISFLTALISRYLGKPYITQTHGMVIQDNRLSARLTDLVFTKRLLKTSAVNLVLSESELASVKQLGIQCRCVILPNGIRINANATIRKHLTNRIAFCSRLDKRKGVEKFIELADLFRDFNIKFEIYGPDSGELQLVKTEIKSRKLENVLEYKGALESQKVQKLLSEIDLLVLPSKDEPFPMIIIEAMSVGTPGLVMPSCGFSELLKTFDENCVAASEDINGLRVSVAALIQRRFLVERRKEIQNYCNDIFSIKSVATDLEEIYSSAISNV